MENSKKLVVYTCIVKDYDTLNEIPAKIFDAVSSTVSFICFTDNPELYGDSKTWTIREIPEDLIKLDKVKAQRVIKIVPQRYVAEAPVSMWVDSNMKFMGSPMDILKSCDLNKFPIWTFKHPQRNCIYDEELAVVRLKKETKEIAGAQIEKYMKDKYPIKNGLAETNVIVRRHDDLPLKRMSYMWAKEVIDGSHRDQLSFNYCCWKTGLKYGEFDNRVTNKMLLRLPHKSPEKLKEEMEKRKREEEEKRKIEDDKKKLIEEKTKIEQEKKELEKEKNKITNLLNSANPQNETENNTYPIIPVVITTHNRTKVARESVRYLCKNLKYAGKLKFCVADDRSNPGHAEAVINAFRECGIPSDDLYLTKTSDNCFGLGASLNNGLNWAFRISDVVLTTEDDWILEKQLNITECVKILISDKTLAGIRLAALGPAIKHDNYNSFLSYVVGNAKLNSIFNNQVMLRHRRIYDKLGMYKTNCSSDDVEQDMRDKYNKLTNYGCESLKTLILSCIRPYGLRDSSSGYFLHAGESTVGHKFIVPDKYKYLYEPERVVVTMTSYPKRIENVATSIMLLLTKQTRSPDEIHLFLAESEFPNLYEDLPETLRNVLQFPKVTLHWLKKNTFCHKRHEIFKYLDDFACVFSIDDDVEYDKNLIKTIMEEHKKHPNSIFNYELYSEHVYEGIKIKYKNFNKYKSSPSIRIRYCGQSMIPSYMYPKYILNEKIENIRDKICPVCDESWTNPWIVHNNISIVNMNFGWGTDISSNIDHKQGLCKSTNQPDKDGLTPREKWLNAVLTTFPSLLKDYERLFNYGKK